MKNFITLRLVVTLLIAVALPTISDQVRGQGVAGVVVTNHIVGPGPQISIGNSAMPIPIDLDPNGGPWFKNVGDPQFNVTGPAIVDMFETIQNVGTEAWGDWHEFLFPAPAGLAPHTWTNVVSLAVNGNPIGFTATGLGTQTLDLFNFSQPVMPGDIFSIHKQLDVNGTAFVSGAFLRIAEYPTPAVPEPASAALFMFGSVLLCGARRRRC